MHFAREGYGWIFGLGALSLILGLLDWQPFAWLVLGLTLFVAFFFRDPDRAIPDDERFIVSPADGRVITIEQHAQGKYLSSRSLSKRSWMPVMLLKWPISSACTR